MKKVVLALCCAAPISVFAQQQFSGNVLDSKTMQPVEGAVVLNVATQTATTTDSNGVFVIKASKGQELSIYRTGYEKIVEKLNSSEFQSFYIDSKTNDLSEVVVTALGIKRQKRSLGYAAQEVSGSDLDKARDPNFVSGLSGKVAGVNIMNSNSGIGGSARITIRGDKSFNINNNQPLFVIDGVPVSNDNFGSSGASFQEVDYGNAAAMINPDDIESINVLKGANAAALYGSRAANGVILITTKSGKKAKGIGVTINTGLTFERPSVLPKFQKKYGQGNDGKFAFKDGLGGGLNDNVDESWGPAFGNGVNIAQFNSPTTNGYRGGDINLVDDGKVGSAADLAARGEIIPSAWKPAFNLNDFFRTGITENTSIAIAGNNDKGNFRMGYTNFYQLGIVPNTDLKMHTLTFAGEQSMNDKLKIGLNATYFNNYSNNRPNISYGTENIMYLFNCWLGQQVDLNAMKNYWMKGRENRDQFNYNYNYHDNPYFQVYENTNGQSANRLLGNARISYQFTPELSLMFRAGMDYSNELRQRRRSFSTQRFPFGSYREEQIENVETNIDFLANYQKRFSENKYGFSINFGGNTRFNKLSNSAQYTRQLTTPGIYSLKNSAVPVVVDVYTPTKKVNSLYAAAQFDYKNLIFLDVTARNDWSSTLTLPQGMQGKSTNSYFYPSVSLSHIFSDILPQNKWLSYGKVRVSFAQVGNDTRPFAFTQAYNPLDPVNDLPTYSSQSVLINKNIKPEISNSFETGLEMNFLDNRIGFDVTYYNMVTENQIINAPLPISSGWSTQIINAGKVRNYGIEAMLMAKPVYNNNFKWQTNFNFSMNRSRVLALADGISVYQIAGKEGVSIEARVGERMGDMYGIVYRRVEDKSSPYYGQIINSDKGRPLASSKMEKLGNYNPDWMLGWNNDISFKNFTFGFLIDSRKGGKLYSYTYVVGREAGQLIETLEGRQDGYDLNKAGNGVISPGVIQNADGSYRPNDVKISAREWNSAITGGRGIKEPAIFDASYIKLRELRFGYTLPNKLMTKIGFKSANVSVVCRNLAILYKNVPHIDPEQMSMSGGTYVPGIESVTLPSTRSIGFNLNLSF